MKEFIHPSTRAIIVDENSTFVTSQGLTLLFSAFTSDKGEDNVLRRMTSPTEYIFNYSSPNIEKHGQASYNNLEWLASGGMIDCLRVMPDNSGFAHATVNIQTKKSVKQVFDVNGELVVLPDVTVRTVVHYTNANNTSKEALSTELKLREKGKTIDGFDNHTLLTVRPKGRGKAYNNMGFILQLNPTYDTTYSFRCYDYYTVQINESGSLETLEGPFLVSLDPEAISNGNESLHISHVVEKYGNYFAIETNNDEFYELGETINPNVHPRILDFFTGVDRLDAEDKSEVYFDETTQKDESVHISLVRYDNGLPTDEMNFVNPDDEIEAAIVSVDNGNRLNKYASRVLAYENARYILSRFRNNAYAATMNLVATVSDSGGTYVLDAGELKNDRTVYDSSFASMTTAESVYDSTDPLEVDVKQQNFDALKLASDYCRDKMKLMIKSMHKSLDYSRAVRDTESTLNTLVAIYDLTSALDAYEVVSIKAAAERGRVITQEAQLLVAKTEGVAERIDAVKTSLTVAKKAINLAESIEIRLGDHEDPIIAAKDQPQADAMIQDAKTQYNAALALYEASIDPYLLFEEVESKVNDAVSAVEIALSTAKDAIALAGIEVQLYVLKENNTEVQTAINAILVSVFESMTTVSAASTPELKAAIETNMKNFIDLCGIKRDDERLNTHTLMLRNYNLYIPFLMGSDGDLDDSNPALKATTSINLLVKAYKGLIDEELIDKKLHPIDMILDANYPLPVKNAMVDLVTKIRDDFISINDTGFLANASQAVDFRKNQFNVSNRMVSIFTQDGTKYDEFTGRDQRFTSTYLLASKIPVNDGLYGLQRNFVGPRRGTVSGLTLTWAPNEIWMEELYKRKVNYVRKDPDRTYFDSQLTSQMFDSPLSLICNMRTILRIKREVEILSENYKHEYNDTETVSDYDKELNNYLSRWQENKACSEIKGSAYASDYDKSQRVMRVRVGMKFTDIIERIFIDLFVNK